MISYPKQIIGLAPLLHPPLHKSPDNFSHYHMSTQQFALSTIKFALSNLSVNGVDAN